MDHVFPARFLRRSRYERVLMLAIAGTPAQIEGESYQPTAMRGWSHVVLRRSDGTATRVMSIDDLVPYLGGVEVTTLNDTVVEHMTLNEFEEDADWLGSPCTGVCPRRALA